MNLTLYELTAEIAAVRDALDEGNLTPEQETEITALLDRALEKLLPAKVSRYCEAVQEFKAFEAACKAEEERIAARRKTAVNVRERMIARLKYGLETAGVDKVAAGTFTVALQSNPPACEVEQMSAVPAKFLVTPPPTVDKRAVLEALKRGEDVPGCVMTVGRHVRIR